VSVPQLPHATGFVWVGAHTPVHIPETHVWPVQVATGVSLTRSAPHCTTVVPLLHTG